MAKSKVAKRIIKKNNNKNAFMMLNVEVVERTTIFTRLNEDDRVCEVRKKEKEHSTFYESKSVQAVRKLKIIKDREYIGRV